ncbi:MAG: ABC transporter substrate-binding protein [Xanthobacteraceae bacterium]
MLPAGAVAGWVSHPLESAAFPRRTPDSDIGRRERRTGRTCQQGHLDSERFRSVHRTRPALCGSLTVRRTLRRESTVFGMKRREFITLLGGSAAWPLAAYAQQPTMPVVGFLGSRSLADSANLVAAFRAGLGESGFIDDRNVTIEFRWAEGHYDRLAGLAADLVSRQVAVLAAPGGIAAGLAAKATTTRIPIIFLTGADPVQFGLVTSLNRPGGNVTGVAILTNTLAPKQLELLHEVVPTAKLVAFLVNPKNPIAETDTRDLHSAASTTRQQILVVKASDESEIENAFAAMVQERAGALLVQSDPFFNSRPPQIVALAAHHAIPAIYQWRDFPVAGGLMSYGTVLADAYRQVGIYTGKILQGTKPGDLPVQQSVKVQLIINLKTAKAFGLTFPLALLGRADEVIE